MTQLLDLVQRFQLALAGDIIERAEDALDGDNNAAGSQGAVHLAELAIADPFEQLIALTAQEQQGTGAWRPRGRRRRRSRYGSRLVYGRRDLRGSGRGRGPGGEDLSRSGSGLAAEMLDQRRA